MSKTCTKCGETKPLVDFPKSSRAKCGRESRCKSCAALAAKNYQKNNKEKVRIAQSVARANRTPEQAESKLKSNLKYRLANRQKIAAANAEYTKANADRVREQKKAWRQRNPEYRAPHNPEARLARIAAYAANPDPIKQRVKAYQEANREKITAWFAAHHKAHPERGRANNAKRKAAKKRATPSWADLDEIKAMYELCVHVEYLTGVPHHVDHIVPLRGKLVSGLHVANNLQILTATENIKKGNRYST